jgi:sugar diacid utilization regulator
VVDGRAVQRENALLRELVTVYQHLTGLTLQDADVSTVMSLLADRTAATVAIVSRSLEIVAAAAPGNAGDGAAERVRTYLASTRLSAVLNSTAQTRRSLRLPAVSGSAPVVVVAPIVVGDDVPAYLMTFGSPHEDDSGDMSLLLTEHAATICGVILGRERIVAAAARQIRDDLVEGLLLGSRDGGEVGRWARHLGYDATRPHRILAAAVEVATSVRAAGKAALGQRAATAIDHYFATRMTGAITSIRDGEVVVVVPDESEQRAAELTQLSWNCLARMREVFPEATITIGIGAPCQDPADIARSYGQARRTIDAVVRLGRQGQVVAFEDLGIHRLLLQVPDLSELRSFAAEVLGELDRHDDQRGAELLATLACYFRENNSPQRTARTLHLHPNTVAYRIRRIQEITGLRLDTYRDRLMAQVAIEILGATQGGLERAPATRAARYAPLPASAPATGGPVSGNGNPTAPKTSPATVRSAPVRAGRLG